MRPAIPWSERIVLAGWMLLTGPMFFGMTIAGLFFLYNVVTEFRFWLRNPAESAFLVSVALGSWVVCGFLFRMTLQDYRKRVRELAVDDEDNENAFDGQWRDEWSSDLEDASTKPTEGPAS